MSRRLYPHDSIGDMYYAKVVQDLDGAAGADKDVATLLREGVAGMDGLSVDLESVQSNLVNLDVSGLGIDAATFATHLDPRGVRGLPGLANTVRFVTYRTITREMIDRAVAEIGEMAAAQPWSA